MPVFVKDVAKVSVGNVPRLGKAGRDNEDDVVAAIVIMNRTLHTNDVVARVRDEIKKINSDGSLPPGVKLVPFYDRTTLVDVTTATVLHNLVFGCLLIFFIQWLFLGDLRSAIIVGANIPFALFFSIIILVLRGEDANLLSVGAVDFGIIVDAAVILVENIYRNFQAGPAAREALLHASRGAANGAPIRRRGSDFAGLASWTDRLRLILISALQIDRAVFFSTAIIVAAFIPLFTMQGVEGQIFGPMARTYAYALVGALIATFTVTPCLASLLLPEHVSEVETAVVRRLRSVYTPVLRWSLDNRRITVAIGLYFPRRLRLPRLAARQRIPADAGGRQSVDSRLDAADHFAGSRHADRHQDPRDSAAPSRGHHRDVAAWPAGRRQRCGGFLQRRVFRAAQAVRRMAAECTKEKLINDLQAEFDKEFVGIDFNFSQYIQDNVEEGLSGVKGANSVKIIGPDLATLEQIARAAMREMAQVQGITDLGVFWVLGQPNLNIKVDRAKAARYGLSVNDVNTVVQAALGGTTATTLLESDRQFGVVVRLAPRIPQQYRRGAQSQGRRADAARQRLYSAERACLDHARYRRLLYFSRTQPALRADQIQRARPRSRRRRRGGAAAHQPQRQAADRLSHRMGRRIRMAAASQEAARHHSSDHARPDSGPALRDVQFVARQLDGAARTSVRGLRRHYWALCLRIGFQHFGRDRIYFAVRRVGDERHPHHQRLLSASRPTIADPIEAMFQRRRASRCGRS